MILYPSTPKLTIDNSLIFSNELRKQDIRFAESVGAEIDYYDPSGWMKLSHDVEEHVDSYGRVLLYAGRGASTFYVEDRPIPLNEGFFLTFDDFDRHSLTIHTHSISLLVLPIKKTLKLKIPRFLGNF